MLFRSISEEDFKLFLENEKLGKTERLRTWGKEMRDKNVGNHNLGSCGYAVKEPIWAKEDAEFRAKNIENPYDKYTDPIAKCFIRSRYHVDKTTGQLITTEKVKELETKLRVRNLITISLSFSNNVF